ncbi:MAG TPA: serine hydrolase [Candidatus Limiplasma sp.]|nr:serine hydrolase [Candidatus Limiplasma sp.]
MKQHGINALGECIRSDYGNTAGIIVQKGGETVYETYCNGFAADQPAHVFSVTKSIISLLIGIAMDQGRIGSVDRKVLAFFPDYTIKRGEKTIQRVTLRDMLTMTAPYKYKSAPYTKYFSSDSWVKASLDLLGGKGEIGPFRYAPLIGPDILSGILTKATGRSALDFAVENLFKPLHITVASNIVFHSKEEQIAIMTGGSTSGWVADPQGINTAGWGLFLTPHDMAKIGRLLLNHGVWGNQQIVSDRWIKESTTPHSYWDNRPYGYLWWILDPQEHSFAALGDGGNTLYVNPAKDIVVAMTGLFKPRAKDRIGLIKEHIEPLFA